jgi:putative Mg2+ transporter-C (MgtC) family protein
MIGGMADAAAMPAMDVIRSDESAAMATARRWYALRMVDISQWEVLLRVLVAGGLGALIGLERERTRRAAGVRTHALVAIGSSLLTATTILYLHDSGGKDDAGEVIRVTSGGRVRGLTTAATVWVTSAIGITAGYGYLVLAALVAGPVTITILLLGIAERRLEESLEDRLVESEEQSRGSGDEGAGNAASTEAEDARG